MVVIKDVAKLAGVSAGTVSKYLNNPLALKESTRTAVEDAIQKLNYIPNLFARNLRVQSARTIAVIAQEISNPFHATIYNTIRKEALKENYSVILYSIDDVDGNLESLLASLPLHYFSGVIICYFHNMDLSFDFARSNPDMPIVVLNNDIKYEEIHKGFQSIYVDFASGIAAATEHLVGLGKRNIAYIGCQTKNTLAEPKLSGFMRVMKRHNLAPHSITHLHKEYSAKTGYESAKIVLEKAERPDAILVDTDIMAIGVMRCLADYGIKVPEDIMLAGFDDIDFSSVYCPALTTVHVPIKEVSVEAFHLLMDQIVNKNCDIKTVHYETNLIVRETTGGFANEKTL